MAEFAVGTLIILGTLGGLHWLGRTLTAREDRARAELIAARLRSSNSPAGPLVPEDEAPYDDRKYLPKWLGYRDHPESKPHVA